MSATACTQILGSDSSPGRSSINAWETEIKRKIQALQSETRRSAANDTVLAEVTSSIQTANTCVNSEISSLSNTSGKIAELNAQILTASAELEQAEKDIKVAKDRVGYIRHPERNTSNYASWFPIDRPISIFSMILLVALTIFLGIFLLLLAMSFAGFNLVIFSPAGQENPIIEMILQQLTFSFWVILIILVSVVIYFTSRK